MQSTVSNFYPFRDRSDWTVDNEYSELFQANPLLDISNLVSSYMLAQLIWCSYFIEKTTIFNPTNFSSFIFKFQNSRRYENGQQKSSIFAQQASHNTWVWLEQHDYQREHKIISDSLKNDLHCCVCVFMWCLAMVPLKTKAGKNAIMQKK